MSGVGITFDETHSFRDWGLRLKKIVIGIADRYRLYVRSRTMATVGRIHISEFTTES